MRTHTRTIGAGILAAFAATLAAGAGDARAETQEASRVALGWQAENAEVVVVGTVEGPAPGGPAAVDGAEDGHEGTSVRVDRTLKGRVAAGEVLRVRAAGHSHPSSEGSAVPHLLFLRAVPPSGPAAPAWESVSGSFGVRPVAPGTPEGRFPDLVKSWLDASAEPDAAALGRLLVSWMDDRDPGVVWSGATDFVRRRDLHGALAEADRERIVAAYRRHPIGKASKTALALAVSASGSPEAPRALVESLLLPESHRIRGLVAEALRRAGSPESEGLLLRALGDATPVQQTALLGALAVVGGPVSAPAVRKLLDAEDTGVRTEAAAALGAIARNCRARDPESRLGVARALAARVSGPEADRLGENEARAVLWALAQLDEEEGFEALREVAARSTRAGVRTWAATLLARPRQSLILRP